MSSSNKTVSRLTLFKIPSESDQQKLLDIYRSMPSKAKKDGKPYIRSVVAGPSYEDARNQGYTVAVVSTFDSLEDFKYYDTQCEAHNELKAFAKTVHQGNMMVFFENAL